MSVFFCAFMMISDDDKWLMSEMRKCVFDDLCIEWHEEELYYNGDALR